LARLAESAPCKVLISNHDTEFTRHIYRNASKIKSKIVGRMISADSSKRNPVKELLAIYE
jgi:DNA adenine methylase